MAPLPGILQVPSTAEAPKLHEFHQISIPWYFCDSYTIEPPIPPHRLRYAGFGQEKTGRAARHKSPSIFIIMHHAWNFLEPRDRWHLAEAHSAFYSYAKLRASARKTPIDWLRGPRPAPTKDQIDSSRSHAMAVALLLFDFQYGDFIRWMGGALHPLAQKLR